MNYQFDTEHISQHIAKFGVLRQEGLFRALLIL